MTLLRRLAIVWTVIATLITVCMTNTPLATASINTIGNDEVTVAQAREATFKQSLQTSHPRYVTMVVTAYTANDSGMNGNGVTASGTVAIPWRTVAASSSWPIGTVFKAPNGMTWVVSDRGGAITADNRLDLYVGRHDTSTAMAWGVREVRLEIVKYGRR